MQDTDAGSLYASAALPDRLKIRPYQREVRQTEMMRPVSIEEETSAKKQLNFPTREGATLLGLPWDKENDTVGASFPQEKADPSKREILSKVARIYDLSCLKATRDVFAVAIAATDEQDTLLEKSTYWKTMRIWGWITRFVHNVRSKKIGRLMGPLTTEETNKARIVWVKRVQTRARAEKHYREDRLQLNLQPNQDGVLECRARIQGHFPVYLPDSQRFTENLVTQVYLGTLHGGVSSTMAEVRQLFWVVRLRGLTKRIVRTCHGFRRFQAEAFSSPPQVVLPKDLKEGQTPFQVVGVDYAGVRL